jgi:dipeptidyl aminopeptidase B
MIDYAIWSPSAAKIAYVLNHDVYVRDMAGSTERVTFDGGAEVFNGVADWVFEEEVFTSAGCIWWSPSSDHLAYIHINESLVPVYSIPYYIPDSTHEGPLAYPEFVDIKYPKPGYPNPVVDVYVHPLGGKPWKVAYTEPLEKRDLLDDLFGFVERDGAGQETDGWGEKKLVTNVEWMGDRMVMVSETNRVSDHYRGVLVDVTTQTAIIVRDEKNEEGWFEVVFRHRMT